MHICHIQLQNFMCHTNFELELSSGLNIIYGTNGSGKSTILTAIMIGLGSGVKGTSRGNNLRSFIKSGTRHAWITIKIALSPQNLTLFAKYGPFVTITKSIGTNSSSLKIVNSDNRKMPASAKDLKNICYGCGIYPANELAMLSQENAKEFLATATPKQKYKKLQEALQQIEIQNHETEMGFKASEWVAYNERFVRKLELLNDEKQRLNDQLYRAEGQSIAQTNLLVVDQALALKSQTSLDNSIKVLNDDISTLRAKIASLNAADTLSETENVANEISKLEEIDLNLELNGLQKLAKEALNEHEMASNDLNSALKDKQTLENALTGFKQQLEVLKTSSSKYSFSELDSKLKMKNKLLKSLQADKNAKTTELNNYEQELNVLKESVDSNLYDYESIKERQTQLKGELKNKQQQLLNAEQGKETSSRGLDFHKHILLQKHVAQTKFNEPVEGPLYMHFECSNTGAKFLSALESLLGRNIACWRVRNSSDRQKLTMLAKKINFDVPIVELREDTWSLNNAFPPPSSQYLRINDVLKSSDSFMRMLVDVNGVDRWALVEGLDEGYNVIKQKGITRAVVLMYTNTNEKTFRVIDTSNYKTDSNFVNTSRALSIKVSSTTLKDTLKEQIQELKNDLLDTDRQVNEAELKLEESQNAFQLLKEKQDLIKQTVDDLSLEINATSNEIEQIVENMQREDNSTEISELEELINSNVTDLQNLTESLSGIQLYCDECLEKKIKTSKDFNLMQEKSNEIDLKLQTLKEKHKQLLDEHNDKSSKLSAIEARVLKNEEEVHKLETELELKKHEFENKFGLVDLANKQLLEFKEMDKSLLNQKRDSLLAEINVDVTETVDLNKTREKLTQVECEIEMYREHLTNSEKSNQYFDNGRKMRQENRARVWNLIKRSLNTTFQQILRRRGFGGEVVINDELKTMDAQAAPESQSNRTTSTLSGGEKSFVQIALLMAVWEVMNIKLTAMDEYDVYMDKTNRSESLLALANTIHRKQLQCILITPQDIDTDVIKNTGVDFLVHVMRPAR